jgi:hypothetical protein
MQNKKAKKSTHSTSKLSKILLGVGAVGTVGAIATWVVIEQKAQARVKRLKAIPMPKPKAAKQTRTQTSSSSSTIQTQGPDTTETREIYTTDNQNQTPTDVVRQDTIPTQPTEQAETHIPKDVQYQGMTLLDYPLNETTGPYSFTVNYQSRPLTVSFKGAPMYGLAKGNQILENAKYIGEILGTSGQKYQPTSNEILQLAYLVYRERSGLGRLSNNVELQRERAALLWCIMNRILSTGRSIYNTLHRSDLVSYYGDFNQTSSMESSLSSQAFDYKTFVKAFFDGYFFNEVPEQTNWSHPITLQKNGSSWRTWHLASGTKDANGNIISNTSRSIPVAMEDCVFSRALN